MEPGGTGFQHGGTEGGTLSSVGSSGGNQRQGMGSPSQLVDSEMKPSLFSPPPPPPCVHVGVGEHRGGEGREGGMF